jgi:hypothetical protein
VVLLVLSDGDRHMGESSYTIPENWDAAA